MDIINLDKGKYTLRISDKGIVDCLRNSEHWRDCAGDNLIYFLALEVLSLKKQLEDNESVIDHLTDELGSALTQASLASDNSRFEY